MPFYETYVRNPFFDENTFVGMPRTDAPLPHFEEAKAYLPKPVWAGHASTLECYWTAWRIAFDHLRRATKANGFKTNYLDSAFNENLFMWDSVFCLFYGLYGLRAFDFIRTLDNFYARQHPDGFICRELSGDGSGDCFPRHDPSSTGPNILPWMEWEYFLRHNDRKRLEAVFPVLAAYHQWLNAHRTWPDGTYFTSGWGSGMDNQPRQNREWIYNRSPSARSAVRTFTHGHLSWVDTCFQQILSARTLVRMGDALGRTHEIPDIQEEADSLTRFVNDRMWDKKVGFYFDRRSDGWLSDVKTIGAYWGLLAEAVPEEKYEWFVSHLDDPKTFNRPHRVPSLSADHETYSRMGGYWLGAVWAPTNFMILKGLTSAGFDTLAHEIAMNHVENVVRVFEETGTLWENYAPEAAVPGEPSKPNMVGWSGLTPITVLFEYLFGLKPDLPRPRLIWDVRLMEAHGVKDYPFGHLGCIDLHCDTRYSPGERPAIRVASPFPLDVTLRWGGGTELIRIQPEEEKKS